ncbi:MAG: MFS transporter, partial [Planctomycetia bacterium]
MNLREFAKAGHPPTLLSAFLYFDISFMVWVLLGALGVTIAKDLNLDDAQKGFLVAVPILGGSILRLAFGLMTDRIGAKNTGTIGLLLTMVPLLLGWLWADSLNDLILVGLLLGVAGASFAVALPLASRWYPPEHQGLALGIAGAGNSGTALATFFAPILVGYVGWKGVFGLSLLPIGIVFILFLLMAKDAPGRPAPKTLGQYGAVLKQLDCWRFCLVYCVTFGGFVGLASFLPIFFNTQYGLDKLQAGYCATACVIAGSFLRPIGGYMADRFGGVTVLSALLGVCGGILLLLATSPTFFVGGALLVLLLALLGTGNGAVFQLVPQVFSKE